MIIEVVLKNGERVEYECVNYVVQIGRLDLCDPEGCLYYDDIISWQVKEEPFECIGSASQQSHAWHAVRALCSSLGMYDGADYMKICSGEQRVLDFIKGLAK